MEIGALTIPVVIFGGPGSGAVVAQSVAALTERTADIEVIGFLNDVLPTGQLISNIPVLGPFANWHALSEDVRFIAPLHKPKTMQERAGVIEQLGIPPQRWISIIDPMSVVAPDVILGPGCHVGPFVSIGPGARLGAHIVLRAGAYVGHDCEIGDFVFVGANAVICGLTTVQNGAYIAPSATIRDRLRLGRFAVVGLGAVVTRDVADFQTVQGVPARGT
jgi:acetyltransferase EpsM